MSRARRIAAVVLACAGLAAGGVRAADFRSVSSPAAILFDAPSIKANKLYIVTRGYPLEVTVQLEGWIKVRDASGAFSWIQSTDLGDERTVVVTAPSAPVRQSADDNAPIVFQAAQNVVLDVVGADTTGWLQVKLDNGTSGYVKASQVWGS